MTDLLTAAQMRAIEAEAIASGAVTGLDLMERAGRGAVDAVFAQWPALATGPHRAVVLCGPGNNGGDGFVVARLLKEWGWAVEVFVLGDAARLPPDARTNHDRWAAMGAVADPDSADLMSADLIVDAVFGIGLTRGFAVPGAIGRACRGLMPDDDRRTGVARPPRVVAIDTVSGMDADSGRYLESEAAGGGEMGAHLTVTFHRPKVGHYLDKGPGLSGTLAVVDLGLRVPPAPEDPFFDWPDPSVVRLVVRPRPSPFSPWLGKDRSAPGAGAHKFDHGHALVLSGGVGRGGAARLAARGALRVGAGLVTVGCPPSALIENACQLTAVMLRRVTDGDGLATMLAGDARINALCLGPGLGLDARAAGLVRAVLKGACDHAPYGGAVVLDADALTLLGRNGALFAALNARCVLTPHGGEFARLFPDIAARLAAPAMTGPAYSKVDATRDAARRAGCTVLFKGPDTVIADPCGRCVIHSAQYDRAAPWLATAGAGDVLAGFITGLLARGFAPMRAAASAAWLHTQCARSYGPGMIAEDLAEELPKVFRTLGL